MLKKRRKLYTAIALIFTIYLIYKGYERWPSRNWKEYRSLVGIWPRLKKEGIENIMFCYARSPQTGDDTDSGFQGILEWFSFRKRDATIVKWWSRHHEVPKECLPECINILDRTMKDARWRWLPNYRVWPVARMLVVTKRGKYIVHADSDISIVAMSKVYGDNWVSHELGEYLRKCGLQTTRYFVPPKEQTISIAIFSSRIHREDFLLDWPPVALFGDKKRTKELFGKLLEPKMVFEGRDWLEKIVDEYEIAFREAEEKKFQSKNCKFYGWIIFVTQDWFYWKNIYLDANAVLGDYMASEQLKAYFDELGITKELLTGKMNVADQNDENTADVNQ
ncbi:MAG: hypothetical protein JW749_04730 [Sedimentisphaerales bacterium]|nr:hypothetical protein [Sedimentisphaerales bacterium]